MSLEMSLKAYKKWNIYSRKSTKAWQRQGKPVTLHPWPISSSPPSPTWWHLHSTWVQARSHSGHPPHPAADQSDVFLRGAVFSGFHPTPPPLATCCRGYVPGEWGLWHGGCARQKHQDIHQPSPTALWSVRCMLEEVSQADRRHPSDGHLLKQDCHPERRHRGSCPSPGAVGGSEVLTRERGRTEQLF